MGLAASQARYLSLTARKTNVEYEGQQVNQQRTALANQSAGLFNQMLALNVPTPPSATDYTKTYYTYTDPSVNGTMTIDSIMIDTEKSDSNRTYADVRCTQKTSDYTVNTVTLGVYPYDGSIGKTTVENSEPKYTYRLNDTPHTITGPDINRSLSNRIKTDDNGITETTKYFQFTINNTVYYVPAVEGEDLEAFKERCNAKGAEITAYATETYTKTDSDTKYVTLNKANDGTGRWTSMDYTYTDDEGETRTVTYNLTQQTVQDEDAYNAAMETYVAEKAIYEKTVEEINAQTLVIQQQDKTLELHLDQLDTEQQAIQTELDAVKKVIDKNIEETFKTFA